MAYIQHPLIRPESLERREYQVRLAERCLERSLLVVLPTGLGKTALALLVVAEHLQRYPGKRCLILAPTRVLVHQHQEFLSHHLLLEEGAVASVTGEDPVKAREAVWQGAPVICATPQVALADFRRGLLRLEEFSLVVFDEAHRAVGRHPYTKLGMAFKARNPSGRSLGLTASPPGDPDSLRVVLATLGLEGVEVRDERSPDVRPYVKRVRVEWVEVELPPLMKRVRGELEKALKARLELLVERGVLARGQVRSPRLKALLEARGRVDSSDNRELREALYSSIRLLHAQGLLETQSLTAFTAFLERLEERGRGLGVKGLLTDRRVRAAYEAAEDALRQGVEHPKVDALIRVLRALRAGERALVFVNFRDSVDLLYSRLVAAGLKVGRLIGKAGKGGLSQREQVAAVEALRRGDYNILLATQVGEEGLDIAECQLVVFYDNVASAIRYVQRRGRTGRRAPGRVVAFLTKGTRDEAYYWLSLRRARAAKRMVREAVEKEEVEEGPLDRFLKEVGEEGPVVVMDVREEPGLKAALEQRGARVKVEALEVGDFVLGEGLAVERKTLEDLARSIMDGRLFRQAAQLKEQYPRSLVVVEWPPGAEPGGVTPQALYGALASLLIDFGLPVLVTRGLEETGELLYRLAHREQVEHRREVRVRPGRKPTELPELQRYIVAGLPGVNATLAERLLRHFGSVYRIFTATEEELRGVEGIGEKLAKRIREVAQTPYKKREETADANPQNEARVAHTSERV